MRFRRLAALPLAVLVCAAIGCGTSGSGPSRPVETLVYITGGTGSQFSFPIDTSGCELQTAGMPTGIQAVNADHQFPGRSFVTPHLFVMENIFQPVSLVIRNDSDVAITVNIFLGLNAQQTSLSIPPGVCQQLLTNMAPGLPAPIPTPNRANPSVAVELCAPINATQDGLDISIPCVGEPGSPDPQNASIGFFASIGDIKASNITSCSMPLVLDTCLTGATFFIQQPKDRVDAVMQINSGQRPFNQAAEMRSELYVNGQLTDADAGDNPVVVGHNF